VNSKWGTIPAIIIAAAIAAPSAGAMPAGGYEPPEEQQEPAGAVVSEPPSPEGQWIDGQVKYQNGQSCSVPYGQMLASSVGYARDPSRGTGLPAVNETYWVRLSLWVLGNPCAGGLPVSAQNALPPNTQLAIDSSHPITCMKRLYRNSTWSPWARMTTTDCPQSWPGGKLTTVLPSYGQYEYVLPVKSTAALGGISQNHKAQATIDGPTDSSFGMNPVRVTPEVYMSTRSASGGGGTSTGSGGNTGAPVNIYPPSLKRTGPAERSCESGTSFAWVNGSFSMNDPHPTRYATQWLLTDDSGDHPVGYDINLAYTKYIPESWIGKRLRCRVIASNDYGTGTADSPELLITAEARL
jgi:hypothetical protein